MSYPPVLLSVAADGLHVVVVVLVLYWTWSVPRWLVICSSSTSFRHNTRLAGSLYKTVYQTQFIANNGAVDSHLSSRYYSKWRSPLLLLVDIGWRLIVAHYAVLCTSSLCCRNRPPPPPPRPMQMNLSAEHHHRRNSQSNDQFMNRNAIAFKWMALVLWRRYLDFRGFWLGVNVRSICCHWHVKNAIFRLIRCFSGCVRYYYLIREMGVLSQKRIVLSKEGKFTAWTVE